ncbi:uncharacterized protein LOC143042958 [Mytilus galloprovincialis]|uniref:uncharacterized protein LOC143042958 n=1 Tax=Mytilus galloprovincialis TaxID=29158 RepID=UPI003F7C9618
MTTMGERPSISNANTWLGPRSLSQIRTDYHSGRPLSCKRKQFHLPNTVPGTKVTEYTFGHSTSYQAKGPILFESPHVARVSSYPGVTFPKLQGNLTSYVSKTDTKTTPKDKNSATTPLEKLRIENRQNTSESIINKILTHAERCRSRDTIGKGSPKTGLTDENCFDYIVIKSFTKSKIQREMRQALNRIILSSKKKTLLPTSPHLSENILRQASALSRATCSSRYTGSSSDRYSAKYERRENLTLNLNLQNIESRNILHKHHNSTQKLKTNEINGNPDSANSTSRQVNKQKSASSRGTERTFVQPTLPKLITGNNSCMFRLNGPILLSAPHGLKIWRGGTDGRRRRIHYREIYVTEIVLKLALHISKYTGYPASFIIWDRKVAMPADFRNLDPNYLTEKQFTQSPWHEALEQFKIYGKENNMPIFHIDIHGKKDRRSNMDVDAGFRAMETRWHSTKFVDMFKEETHSAFTKVFQDSAYEKRGMKYAINVDPLLCGDWGGDLYTMTTQSVCLGIPSFQLEIPRTVRAHMVEDDELTSKFAKAIVDIYSKCVLKDKHLPSKGNDMSTTEFLEKIYNDHLKIEKAFPEKQI